MKKTVSSRSRKSEMHSEYDFSSGVRGKYVKQFNVGTNLVLLKPEIAKAFPDSESVNQALEQLLVVTRLVKTRR